MRGLLSRPNCEGPTTRRAAANQPCCSTHALPPRAWSRQLAASTRAEAQRGERASFSLPAVALAAPSVSSSSFMAMTNAGSDFAQPSTSTNLVDAYLNELPELLQRLSDSSGRESSCRDLCARLLSMLAEAVDTQFTGLRGMQSATLASGAFSTLLVLAQQGVPDAFECLQRLCFKNPNGCRVIEQQGVVTLIAAQMPVQTAVLQASMCHLLTALAAFSDSSHQLLAESGLIPLLVLFCRPSSGLRIGDEDLDESMSLLQLRSTAVLRSLAHNPEMHEMLAGSGAVDVLAGIMLQTKDPSARINAALAVAVLVGKCEEKSSKLQLDESLVVLLLEVLESACVGHMSYGSWWTVWKLCQGISSLASNDLNKELITARGGVEIMAEVLHRKHFNNEAAHRYAISTIWNLAFNENSRRIILETHGLVDTLRLCMETSESPATREAAKGALWTLGLEEEIKAFSSMDQAASTSDLLADPEDSNAPLTGPSSPWERKPPVAQQQGHIMLSYEWGQQDNVLLIKNELQKAGYKTWMDVDEMSGSTLEAMAHAVENSSVVLMCMSSKYKESQACRTEAEYAFQRRKKIVPLVLEANYKASGWLGALIGTRLYFDMSETRKIMANSTALFKELGAPQDQVGPLAGNAGALASVEDSRSVSAGGSSAGGMLALSDQLLTQTSAEGLEAESWSCEDVSEWLRQVCRLSESAVECFASKHVDGMALRGLLRMSADSRLVHEALLEEFGLELIGQRLRLIEQLHRLFLASDYY